MSHNLGTEQNATFFSENSIKKTKKCRFFSGHGLMNNSNTNYLTQATIQFNSNESLF